MHFLKYTFFSFALACKTLLLSAQTGQIAIPRVEQMPNQPAPYNMRDWREVALRYDSFVYDLQKTGQYLPLSYLGPAGINYPQNATFGLHTYVGTNSPLGNEAISACPERWDQEAHAFGRTYERDPASDRADRQRALPTRSFMPADSR